MSHIGARIGEWWRPWGRQFATAWQRWKWPIAGYAVAIVGVILTPLATRLGTNLEAWLWPPSAKLNFQVLAGSEDSEEIALAFTNEGERQAVVTGVEVCDSKSVVGFYAVDPDTARPKLPMELITDDGRDTMSRFRGALQKREMASACLPGAVERTHRLSDDVTVPPHDARTLRFRLPENIRLRETFGGFSIEPLPANDWCLLVAQTTDGPITQMLWCNSRPAIPGPEASGYPTAIATPAHAGLSGPSARRLEPDSPPAVAGDRGTTGLGTQTSDPAGAPPRVADAMTAEPCSSSAWWMSFWSAAGTVAAAIAAIVGLVVAVRTARAQAKASSEALRLALFDKRYAVLQAIGEMLSKAGRDAALDHRDVLVLRAKTAMARFIFDEKMMWYLDALIDSATHFVVASHVVERYAPNTPEREAAVEREMMLLGWLMDELKDLQNRFARYLTFRPE